MYLCDWGKRPAVIECHLDGSECHVIVEVLGGHPNDVVMETSQRGRDAKKMLYWTDSLLDKISVNVVGNHGDDNVESQEIRLTVPQ